MRAIMCSIVSAFFRHLLWLSVCDSGDVESGAVEDCSEADKVPATDRCYFQASFAMVETGASWTELFLAFLLILEQAGHSGHVGVRVVLWCYCRRDIISLIIPSDRRPNSITISSAEILI